MYGYSMCNHIEHVWSFIQGNMSLFLLQMIFASKPGGSPQHFGRMYDKKVNLLGLISLALPQESTPPQLQNAWPQLMAGTMRLLTTLKEQQVCLF